MGGFISPPQRRASGPQSQNLPAESTCQKTFWRGLHFARVTCRNELYLYFIHSSPWNPTPKRLGVTGPSFAAGDGRPGSFAKQSRENVSIGPVVCRLQCCLQCCQVGCGPSVSRSSLGPRRTNVVHWTW